MANIKCFSSKSPVKRILNYVKNPQKTNEQLIVGINCSVENVRDEMNYTKTHYKKNEGIQYYHVIQSFKPGEITEGKCNELGIELAKKIALNYECLVVTHIDKEHLHNHIVINSVSYTDGKKYQIENGAYKIKKESNMICEREHLSVIEDKKINATKEERKEIKENEKIKPMSSNEYRAAINKDKEWWKGQLIIDIKQCKMQSNSKDEFIKGMEEKGYKVNWTDSRKYITYTTDKGKFRDNKLHDENLLKEAMENEFRQATRNEYDKAAEGNSTGDSSQGVIESITRRTIEGSQQELHRSEDRIPKSVRTNLYTESTEQGNLNINRQYNGASKDDSREPRNVAEEGKRQYERTNRGTRKVQEISSEGSAARGSEKYAQAGESKDIISGEGNFNEDRIISNSNNMPINNNSNDYYSKINIKSKEGKIMSNDNINSMQEKKIIEENLAFRNVIEKENQLIEERKQEEQRLREEKQRENAIRRKREAERKASNNYKDSNVAKYNIDGNKNIDITIQEIKDLQEAIIKESEKPVSRKQESYKSNIDNVYKNKSVENIDSKIKDIGELQKNIVKNGTTRENRRYKDFDEVKKQVENQMQSGRALDEIKNNVREMNSDIEKEIINSKGDTQLGEDLRAIQKHCNTEINNELDRNKEYFEGLYKNVKSGARISETPGYLQKSFADMNKEMSRSIGNVTLEAKETAELIKGESKEQKLVNTCEKAYEYIEKAEQRVKETKAENKIFDIKGNFERNQFIKDLTKEIDKQREVLEHNGINTEGDLDKHKEGVDNKLEYAKEWIKDQKQEDLLKRKELDKENNKDKEKEINQVEKEKKELLQNQSIQQNIVKKESKEEMER